MASYGTIDGIMSGLNTTEIIDAIMKVEHQQVDLYTEKQTAYTQKLTTWQTINTYMLAFKSQADVLSKATLWNSKKVASSDDTSIAVSSSGSSAVGTYSVSVEQLAQNHQIASQGFSESTAIVGVGTVEIKVGSGTAQTITLEAGANSLESLKNAINDASMGVTAAIVNDGSSQNPYRLLLSANDTGVANKITITSSLTGGTVPDFTTCRFDTVELLDWDDNATSSPTIAADSQYTGTTNKTYTFTVEGVGEQEIGSSPISIAWTDGTNSGVITVNSIGEQIALTGDGADGLALSFSSGQLVAGDTFQIQAMAPTIQAAKDAMLRLGSDGSGGSAITVASSINRITTLIDGVTLDLLEVTDSPVQITVEADHSSIISTVSQFVEKYNSFADFIDEQLSYDSETGKAGVLLGETSLINLLSDVRTYITKKVSGIDGAFDKLSDVGIKFNISGDLILDTSVLTEKLNESSEDVKKLFLANGTSNNSYIEYLSMGARTVPTLSGYDVDITQAPLQGKMVAGTIADPSVTNLILDSSNNNIRLKINGVISNTISLAQGMYTSGEELAQELEDKINEDQSLSANEVEVAWIDDGDSGHFEITSTLWGANSNVEIDVEPSGSAHTILGLGNATSTAGQDVAGTIDGEPATGVGQILTGNTDNDNTAGLKLKISLTSDMLGDGPEARIVLTKGYGALFSDKLAAYTEPSTGILRSRAGSIQKQIDDLADQIEKKEE